MQSKPAKKRLTKKWVAPIALILILIAATSAALALNFNGDVAASQREFYVGVEIAYGNYTDFTAVVDEVKNYTNLVVFGLPEMTKNQTLLNMTCDYAYNSGLHFIVLLTNTSQYADWVGYTPAEWVASAMQKYGDKFLAVYRWDEPGGDQLDNSKYQEVKSATDYTDAANQYVNVLREHVDYYKNIGAKVVTADYCFYWFDYKVGYDAVFAEFGWNNSREQQIAQVRGAARANNKDWGAIVTWDYGDYPGSPYIESGPELYDDLLLAYNNGAKYAVVFNYPQIATAKYGILGQEHLDALQQFWNYIGSNQPADPDYKNADVAYVLPADYAFGFRRPTDSVWGLWGGDATSQKIYSDVEDLIAQHGAGFDIVCDYPNLLADAKDRYNLLIFWNGTQTARR
ncbi:MAG: hypothetical protein ACQCN4_12905 [Candidatus Bathyarchaeia archaeon]|jgi:hypothetical protein